MSCPHPEPAWGPWVLAGAVACACIGAAILVRELRKPIRKA